VKLADKLNNLEDLMRVAPQGWSARRVAGYAAWSKHVIDGARGSNLALERQLDQVLSRLLAEQGDESDLFTWYMNEMDKTND
jgi:hypothetical protein